MDVIILAGGLGTRLRDAVPDLPKALAPINGRPFLDLILQQLDAFGSVSRVILAVGYRADDIQSRYANARSYGFAFEFSREESPLGTGGALAKALKCAASAYVLVMNGDTFVDFELGALISHHQAKRAQITMVVTRVADAARYGSVTLDPASLQVTGFVEKSAAAGPGYINAGIYLMTREALEPLAVQQSSLERDLLPLHMASTYGYVVQGRFIDIGVPESYAQAPRYLQRSDGSGHA